MYATLLQGVWEAQDSQSGSVSLPIFPPLISRQEVWRDAPVQSQTVRCRTFLAGDAGAQAG